MYYLFMKILNYLCSYAFHKDKVKRNYSLLKYTKNNQQKNLIQLLQFSFNPKFYNYYNRIKFLKNLLKIKIISIFCLSLSKPDFPK